MSLINRIFLTAVAGAAGIKVLPHRATTCCSGPAQIARNLYSAVARRPSFWQGLAEARANLHSEQHVPYGEHPRIPSADGSNRIHLEIPDLDEKTQLLHFCWIGTFGKDASEEELQHNGMYARIGATAAAHHIDAAKKKSEGAVAGPNVKVIVWLYDHDFEYRIFQNPGEAVSEFVKLKEKYFGCFAEELRKHIEVRRVVDAIGVAEQHDCLRQCKDCIFLKTQSPGKNGCANCGEQGVLSPSCNYRKMLEKQL